MLPMRIFKWPGKQKTLGNGDCWWTLFKKNYLLDHTILGDKSSGWENNCTCLYIYFFFFRFLDSPDFNCIPRHNFCCCYCRFQRLLWYFEEHFQKTAYMIENIAGCSNSFGRKSARAHTRTHKRNFQQYSLDRLGKIFTFH